MTGCRNRRLRVFVVFSFVVLLGTSLAPPGVSSPASSREVEATEVSRSSSSEGCDCIFWFGYDANDDGYADGGETWTFDHGAELEGWKVVNLTRPEYLPAWHRIDETEWIDGGNTEPVPVISGDYSFWAGVFENKADSLGWAGGVGYGNLWKERLKSPAYEYDGTGSVVLSFNYWVNLENGSDYMHVILSVPSLGTEVALRDPGFTGTWGTPSAPESYSCLITELESLAGGAPLEFFIEFELASDIGASDQDGDYDTPYGPFCIDNIELQNNLVGGNVLHTFEDTTEGYTAYSAGYVLDCVDVCGVDCYTLAVECEPAAEMSGNVLELHDGLCDAGFHPDGQHVMLISPKINISDICGGPYDFCDIFADLDIYAALPQVDGVGWRPGWKYHYFDNFDVGRWSDRVGPSSYYFYSDTLCQRARTVGSAYMPPPFTEHGADTVQFIIELLSSCDTFVHPPYDCSGVTNFSPLFDNIQIGLAVHDTSALRVPSCCYPTIQSALDAADPGDTVLVADGVYSEYNLDFMGKDVVLKSENGWSSTTIDCLDSGRAFLFDSGETPAAMIDGFTIENGYDLVYGGAVVCSLGSSPTIGNCTFVNCIIGGGTCDNGGGAIYVKDASPIIRDCLIYRCSAMGDYSYGSAIYARDSSPSVEGCVINECDSPGGLPAAITLRGAVSGAVERCTISDCSVAIMALDVAGGFEVRQCTIAGNVRGVECYGLVNIGLYECVIVGNCFWGVATNCNQLTISGCTIASNAWLGLYMEGEETVQVDSSVIWGNRTSLQSDGAVSFMATCSNIDTSRISVGDSTVIFDYGPTNIYADPLFCDPRPWTEAPTTAGNYNLQSPSPCLAMNNSCGTLMGALTQGCVPNYIAETDTGQDVQATMGSVVVTYDAVTDSGVTTLILDDDGPDVPSGFTIVPAEPPTYYEIYTSAAFQGTLTVCVTYDESDVAGPESTLALWHYNMDVRPPDWVDITVSLDTVSNVLCGKATSLSPFAVLEQDPVAGVASEIDSPLSFEVHPSFPNPFNPAATMIYSISEATEVSISLYDVSGRLVRVLVDRETQQAGEREVIWDGRDDSGTRVASGVYFCRVQAGALVKTERMVLLK